MKYTYEVKTLAFDRYPATTNRSLQPWNAADELILEFLKDENLIEKHTVIFNDRFGFLSAFLSGAASFTVIEFKSQEKAIRNNLAQNKIRFSDSNFLSPLTPFSNPIDLALIKIPKSLDLLRLYFQQLSSSLTKDAMVIGGFMTKYFSPQILTIAGDYFGHVEQSRAKKKARLLILKKPKSVPASSLLHSIPLDENTNIKQYYGVFSANNIDYATRYLIDHLQIKPSEQRILDVGSGSGVIAYSIQSKHADRKLHLVDDSILAIESAKLNLNHQNTHFHFDDNLHQFEDDFFDLAVSNPPFHFEHETNIEVSIGLFKDVHRCLKTGGRFLCVANKHLNYKTHLEKIFQSVTILAENEKYVVYESFKLV